MNRKPKIALVVPWFGQFCYGGAETLTTELARHLQNSGLKVKVLTTTVRDFTGNWNDNYYRPGSFVEDGLEVERFKVKPGNHRIFQELVRKINLGVTLNSVQEKNFIENSVRSLELENYLANNQADYGLFVFAPYLYGTTYFGLGAVSKKAVLIGCLHDEPYAYLKIFGKMYQRPRALVYLSQPEKMLAEKLYGVAGRPSILGGALERPPEGNADEFRRKFKIREDFIIYSGRKDEGKNVPLLIRYFLRYKKENPSSLKLVLIGPGRPVFSGGSEIIDLGLLSATDKAGALAAAHFLVQPSVNESFSIVIMESWLAGRPVVVHRDCPTTRDFVERSQAGLYFGAYPEFSEAIDYLLKNPASSERLAQNGRRFVEGNLLWNRVIKKYLEFFESLVL
jgi:glycosyltransferase involved in cell wall biosynthesis